MENELASNIGSSPSTEQPLMRKQRSQDSQFFAHHSIQMPSEEGNLDLQSAIKDIIDIMKNEASQTNMNLAGND